MFTTQTQIQTQKHIHKNHHHYMTSIAIIKACHMRCSGGSLNQSVHTNTTQIRTQTQIQTQIHKKHHHHMASIAIIAACHMGCRGEVSIGVGHPQWSLWENRLYVDGLSSYCLVSRQCVENSAIRTLYQKKFYVRCVIRSGIDLVMCVP